MKNTCISALGRQAKRRGLGKFFLAAMWLLCSWALFPACGEQNGESQEAESMPPSDELLETAQPEGQEYASKSDKVFYTIPSPLEVISILKKAGATYDKAILNPVESVSRYATNGSMALNLGIYGADLSYSSIFEQTQETMQYFAAAKKLADALNITTAFDKETVAKIEKNISNRDSLISLISDSYWEADAYLKENQRSSTAALVITGGWIEGLFISCKVAESAPKNQEIVSRIGEQKLTINNLLALLDRYSDETVKSLRNELMPLQEIYNGVELVYTRKDPITNPKTNVTVLQTTSKITISPEQLARIKKSVTDVRTKIVQ